MKGSSKKRGANGLRRRCPQCKKLRKFCEPPGGQGGEHHPQRPRWGQRDGRWVCGWCISRETTREACDDTETPRP